MSSPGGIRPPRSFRVGSCSGWSARPARRGRQFDRHLLVTGSSARNFERQLGGMDRRATRVVQPIITRLVVSGPGRSTFRRRDDHCMRRFSGLERNRYLADQRNQPGISQLLDGYNTFVAASNGRRRPTGDDDLSGSFESWLGLTPLPRRIPFEEWRRSS